MKKKTKEILKSRWVIVAFAVLAGALLVLAIRFITYQPEHVHYHANLAVYINGQHEEFQGPRYYQEVTACSTEHSNNPKSRTHLHDNVNDVVHVHDSAVTWGQFFENLGWTLGPTSIIDETGKVYSENSDNKLFLILNGQDYTGVGGVANKVIDSRDRLLISYGGTIGQAMDQFKSVATTADKYNHSPDPKSCGGDDSPSFKERLENVF